MALSQRFRLGFRHMSVPIRNVQTGGDVVEESNTFPNIFEPSIHLSPSCFQLGDSHGSMAMLVLLQAFCLGVAGLVHSFWFLGHFEKNENKKRNFTFCKTKTGKSKTCCNILSGLQHKWLDFKKFPIISGVQSHWAISFMDFSLCFFPCFFLQNSEAWGWRPTIHAVCRKKKHHTLWVQIDDRQLVVCTKLIEKYARDNRRWKCQKDMNKTITWPGKKESFGKNETKKTPNKQLQVGHDEKTTGASSMSQRRERLGKKPLFWGLGKRENCQCCSFLWA